MRTMKDIADALSAMKFRKKVFGGVDEADVWKKLEALQNTYQLVYDEQAAYYCRDVLRQLALLDFPLQTGETPLQYLERLRAQEPFGTGPDLSPVFARITLPRWWASAPVIRAVSPEISLVK